MKIVITSRAPFIAGAEIAGERLALGLMNDGHDVLMVVGTNGEALARFKQNGIRCIHIPVTYTGQGLGFKYRRYRRDLRNLLAHERPDIVHSNDLPTHQITSDAAKPLGIPRVCHHRWIFGGEATDWFNKFGSEQHVFVSNAVMQELREQSETLKNESCEVLYDGLEIPPPPNEDDRVQAKQKIGMSIGKLSVLFAGQIVERKGVADIIHAWSMLEQRQKECADLIIVGEDLESDGSYRIQMQQLAEELKIPARFVGFQKNVNEWLTASDIVLVPSHQEPLGNATLEAMAMARPVIGTKVGGIPEMIDHDKTGLLVEPKNPEELSKALYVLLDNKKKRLDYGKAARNKCESIFSIKSHVENTLTIYNRLVNNRAHSDKKHDCLR